MGFSIVVMAVHHALAGFRDLLTGFFSSSMALKISAGTMMVLSYAALAVFISGLMLAITYVIPPALAEVFLFVFPGNVNACLAAVVTTEAGCAGYKAYQLGFGR